MLPLQVAPKKTPINLRLILDCRLVNKYVQLLPFKQVGLEAVHQQICTDDVLCSIDLKDGFFHIPVHQNSQNYLGFQWKCQYLVWQVLPFGLSCSPYYFYKTLRPVLLHLREQGVHLADFVDDILLMSNRDKCQWTKLSVLQSCGWTINFEKSVLCWRTSCDFIGYNVSVGQKGPWL